MIISPPYVHYRDKNLEELASEKIKIPMDAKLESLNVSNASSVILFEVFRQREL